MGSYEKTLWTCKHTAVTTSPKILRIRQYLKLFHKMESVKESFSVDLQGGFHVKRDCVEPKAFLQPLQFPRPLHRLRSVKWVSLCDMQFVKIFDWLWRCEASWEIRSYYIPDFKSSDFGELRNVREVVKTIDRPVIVHISVSRDMMFCERMWPAGLHMVVSVIDPMAVQWLGKAHLPK